MPFKAKYSIFAVVMIGNKEINTKVLDTFTFLTEFLETKYILYIYINLRNKNNCFFFAIFRLTSSSWQFDKYTR